MTSKEIFMMIRILVYRMWRAIDPSDQYDVFIVLSLCIVCRKRGGERKRKGV